MKKLILPVLVFLIIGALAAYLLMKEGGKNSTINVGSKEFQMEDTAAIDKIFLADMQGNEVTLIRKNQEWMVNGEYPVNKSRKDILLKTLAKMKVKRPVPKNTRNTVIKSMASSGVKTEIYKKGELANIIYVGTPTPDGLGTYMAIGNEDKEPYIIHIPGFNGYLSSRFFARPEEWRTKKLLSYQPGQIKEAGVIYPDSMERSFTIIALPEHEFLVRDSEGNEEKVTHVAEAIKFYLRFGDQQYEKKLEASAKQVNDSLTNETPYAKIKVLPKSGTEQVLSLYPVDPGKTTSPGVPDEMMQVDKYFVRDSKRPGEVFIMQRGRLKKILKKYTVFASTI